MNVTHILCISIPPVRFRSHCSAGHCHLVLNGGISLTLNFPTATSTSLVNAANDDELAPVG